VRHSGARGLHRHPTAVDDAAYAEYVERIGSYMQKAQREAQLRTSWANPDPEYEEATAAFVRRILAHIDAGTTDEGDAWREPVQNYLDPIRFSAELETTGGSFTADLLIAGMGVYWCKASAEFVKFAERLGAPVLTTTKCKGMIPEDHPLRAGCIIGGGRGTLGLRERGLRSRRPGLLRSRRRLGRRPLSG